MAAKDFTCPHCLYEAPMFMFENVDNGKLKCKRCRSTFDDPNAYDMDVTYADCDSQRVVTRFPFFLNGQNSSVRVREGYMALIVGNNGRKLWLYANDNHVTNMPAGFQLYYVCLTPQIIWGTKDISEFGVHGSAYLSISKEYIESYCGVDGHILTLEEHLRTLVVKRITQYIQETIGRSNIALLKHSEGYVNALGLLEEGVSLTGVEPRGFRSTDGSRGNISFRFSDFHETDAKRLPQSSKRVVDNAPLPKKAYLIKDGVEEVFIRNASKTERHKAGEKIDMGMLQGVNKLMRFYAKEFEFIHGWGLYNQRGRAGGYFSAHGTLSFYIDSTEQMSLRLSSTPNWEEFIERFFSDVIKKEVSSALKKILDVHTMREDFDPAKIRNYLSAMSVELTNVLNGEGPNGGAPAFRKHGLRVNRLDILHVDFYSTRR